VAIGQTDTKGRFNLTWIRIDQFEDAKPLYRGCPVDFGTLSTDRGSFMDIFSSTCLKGCSADEKYEIADLIENMIIFKDPGAIIGNIKVDSSYDVGGRAFIGVDNETGIRPETANCYAMRKLARPFFCR